MQREHDGPADAARPPRHGRRPVPIRHCTYAPRRMVNRIRSVHIAIDEALVMSRTVLRILGKFNSKAVKVDKPRDGEGPTRAAGGPEAGGLPDETPPAGP